MFAAQRFSDYKHQYKKVKISIQHLPFNKTLEGCYAPMYSCILKTPQVGNQIINNCSINALVISHPMLSVYFSFS